MSSAVFVSQAWCCQAAIYFPRESASYLTTLLYTPITIRLNTMAFDNVASLLLQPDFSAFRHPKQSIRNTVAGPFLIHHHDGENKFVLAVQDSKRNISSHISPRNLFHTAIHRVKHYEELIFVIEVSRPITWCPQVWQ